MPFVPEAPAWLHVQVTTLKGPWPAADVIADLVQSRRRFPRMPSPRRRCAEWPSGMCTWPGRPTWGHLLALNAWLNVSTAKALPDMAPLANMHGGISAMPDCKHSWYQKTPHAKPLLRSPLSSSCILQVGHAPTSGLTSDVP